MNLVERAKNILLTPKTEWPVIATEVTSSTALWTTYIIPLAAIVLVAEVLRWVLFGPHLLLLLIAAIVRFVLMLVGLRIIAWLSDLLAPTFGGVKNPTKALELVAYALTASWVASILRILPSGFIGLLVLLASFYGLYLFYLGAPYLLRVPQDKAAAFTVVVTVCVIVIGAIFGTIAGVVMTSAGLGYNTFAVDARPSRAAKDAQLAAMAATVQAAASQMAEQQKAAAAAAATSSAIPSTAMTAPVGVPALPGGVAADPVDKEALKAMIPDAVDGLSRTSLEAEKGGVAGFSVSSAEAKYGDAQKRLDLKITDVAGTPMTLAALAAWSNVEIDRSGETGYEKTSKVNGRPTHEKFDKPTSQGEYTVLVGNRFVVEASGNVDMSTLKDAVNAVGLDKLDAMKDLGVHKAG